MSSNHEIVELKIENRLFQLRLKDIARELGGYIREDSLDEEHKTHCNLRQSNSSYNTWGVPTMKSLKIPFKNMPRVWNELNTKPNIDLI